MFHCSGGTYIPPDHSQLSAGDAVKVELDPDLLKIAQEEHGGWNDAMAEVRTVCGGSGVAEHYID